MADLVLVRSMSLVCDYRDKCKHMDFVELRSYIDSRLADLTIRVDRASEGPTTKEDFLELCQLLEQRISEPARLSPGLAALEQQLRDLSAALHAMPDNSRSRRRSIKKLERRIDFLQKEIMPLRQREKAEYAASRNRYYRRSDRSRFAQRVRRDVEAVFAFGTSIQATRLYWRVLPPGEWTLDSVLRHYDHLQRLNPHIRYDTDRLQKLFSLHPSTCYIGLDEFDGYIVFAFTHTRKVVLECPVYGNAIYAIRDNWQGLSTCSKYELLTDYPTLVYRIIHTGDWFWRLKASLR